MADEATSLEKAAKILGINLDEQPNIFSNGWLDRLPLNDIAKLQFPDEEDKQKELIQQTKNYIEHNTFKVDRHYYINEADSDNPILSAGAFNYYCFLTETLGNEHTLSWLKAQNLTNPRLVDVENGLDAWLGYELICEYWATGKKLFDAFYNQDDQKEKIIAAIQNGSLRAMVERQVKKNEQINTNDGFIEVIDKPEILKIKNGYLGNDYVRITINNADFYGWLVRTNQWPLHEGCLLNYWWDGQLHSSDPKEHLEALDCMHAHISNGKAINWNYWGNREFSSFQAPRLVNYIDPIEWAENDYKQGKIPDDLLKEMKRLEEWLNQKSQTWKFDTLIPALAEYSAIADSSINPPFGMVEVKENTLIADAVVDDGRTGYQSRDDDFRKWISDEKPDLGSMKWDDIHKELITRNLGLWTSGFKDWKKQQQIHKGSPGRKSVI
jgi:hypothetical protein